MPEPTQIALLVGRVLFGAYFVFAGINHFRMHKVMTAYTAAKKVPFPSLAVFGTGLLLTAGGLSLITGAYVVLGLAALALFLIGTTPMMHNFWTVPDPAARQAEMGNFIRNVALLGAVLAFTALPAPWAWSLGGTLW